MTLSSQYQRQYAWRAWATIYAALPLQPGQLDAVSGAYQVHEMDGDNVPTRPVGDLDGRDVEMLMIKWDASGAASVVLRLTRPDEPGLGRVIRGTDVHLPEPVARLRSGPLRAMRVPGEGGSGERDALVATDGTVLLSAASLVEVVLPKELTEGCGP